MVKLRWGRLTKSTNKEHFTLSKLSRTYFKAMFENGITFAFFVKFLKSEIETSSPSSNCYMSAYVDQTSKAISFILEHLESKWNRQQRIFKEIISKTNKGMLYSNSRFCNLFLTATPALFCCCCFHRIKITNLNVGSQIIATTVDPKPPNTLQENVTITFNYDKVSSLNN